MARWVRKVRDPVLPKLDPKTARLLAACADAERPLDTSPAQCANIVQDFYCCRQLGRKGEVVGNTLGLKLGPLLLAACADADAECPHDTFTVQCAKFGFKLLTVCQIPN